MTEVEQYKAEMNDTKQKIAELAKKAALVTSKIVVRKLELEAIGRENKKGKTTDPVLIRLYAMDEEFNTTLRDLHKRRKELNKLIPPPEKKPQKPRGERPKNRVVMGREFRDCNAYERRLALLLAFEVGQERYNELKRQASDDYRNRETEFYTGPRPRWDDICRSPENRENYERMLKNNFNQYSGAKFDEH